jgi:hypothetical protein
MDMVQTISVFCAEILNGVKKYILHVSIECPNVWVGKKGFYPFFIFYFCLFKVVSYTHYLIHAIGIRI